MNLLMSTIARLLFAIPFLVFGLMHFMATSTMAQLIPTFLPAPYFFVYVSGLGLILAGVSIVIQKHTALACKLLALLLGAIIVCIHIPGLNNPEMKRIAMVGLLKDLGLIGAALLLAGISEEDQADSYSAPYVDASSSSNKDLRPPEQPLKSHLTDINSANEKDTTESFVQSFSRDVSNITEDSDTNSSSDGDDDDLLVTA